MKMRVEAASNYLYTSQLRATDRAREITATAAQAANAPQALEDAPCVESSKPVDFSRMTIQEMLDWIGEQERKGEISSEESLDFSLWAISCGYRCDEATGRIWCVGKDEALDFTQTVREGVAFARAHEYDDGGRYQRAMEAGWATMLRAQGLSRSVDVFA